MNVSAQGDGHDVEDDVEAETAAALAQAGGKKRVEDTRQVVGRNAATIVAHPQDDPIIGAGQHQETDLAPHLVVEGVHQCVDRQIGDNLPERPRKAVENDSRRNVDLNPVRRMFEAVGVTVSRLMRVRYGPLILPPSLKRGRSEELNDAQITALLEAVGMGRKTRRPMV